MNPIKIANDEASRPDRLGRSLDRPRPQAVPVENQRRFERLVEQNPKERGRSTPAAAAGSESTTRPTRGAEAEVTKERILSLLEHDGHPRGSGDAHEANGSDEHSHSNDCNHLTLDDSAPASEATLVEVEVEVETACDSNVSTAIDPTHLPSPFELFSNTPLAPSTPLSRPVDSDHRLLDLAQQVTDRILVSDASSAVQEVHLKVRDSILPGTELHLCQEAGQLQVRIITDQQRSFDFLVTQQAPLLAMLEQRLTRPVSVEVDLQSKEHSDHQHEPSDSSSHQQHPSRDSYSQETNQ